MNMIHFIAKKPNDEGKSVNMTTFIDHIISYTPESEDPSRSYLKLSCGLLINVRDSVTSIEKQIQEGKSQISSKFHFTAFWQEGDIESDIEINKKNAEEINKVINKVINRKTIIRDLNGEEKVTLDHFQDVRKEYNDTGFYKIKPL